MMQVSCEWVHQAYPQAKLYGTARHVSKLPNLPWLDKLLEDPETQALFAEDLDLRTPAGVDFISTNVNVHFSSILAFHKASQTLHVDDTLMFYPTPKVAQIFGFKEGTVQLHPTLVGALKRRRGASQDFRAWVRKFVAEWEMTNLCAAHLGVLLGKDNTGASLKSRVESALFVAEPVLIAHDLFYGRNANSAP
jgi:hypothetical protein